MEFDELIDFDELIEAHLYKVKIGHSDYDNYMLEGIRRIRALRILVYTELNSEMEKLTCSCVTRRFVGLNYYRGYR